ncbi:MAG: TlpA family protein disulfide reductase [Cytophagales bacterium]|nr:TlpA family protein disulfide reductase [Cytophagales bacterium]MDW8384753.1 TlpA disulfide reductase family protein [Flammeovirgaceae bacterium]
MKSLLLFFLLNFLYSEANSTELATLVLNLSSSQVGRTGKIFCYTDKFFLSKQIVSVTHLQQPTVWVFEIPKEDVFLLEIDNNEYEIYLKPHYTYKLFFDQEENLIRVESEDFVNDYILQVRKYIANFLASYQDKAGKFTKEFKKHEYELILHLSEEIKKQPFYLKADSKISNLIDFELIRFQTDYLLSNKYPIDFIERKVLDIEQFPENTIFWLWLDELFTFEKNIVVKNKHGVWLQRYNLAYLTASETDGTWIYESFKKEIQAENFPTKIQEILWLKGLIIAYEVGNVNIETLRNDLQYLSEHAQLSDVRAYAQQLQANFNRITIGQTLPDFFVYDMRGDKMNIFSYFGKPTLLEFWATWCTVCVKEMKEIPGLVEKYKDEFQVVSISVDDQLEKVQRYLKLNPSFDWTFLWLPEYKSVAERLGISGFPAYFLVDSKGRLKYVLEGSPKSELKTILSLVEDSD